MPENTNMTMEEEIIAQGEHMRKMQIGCKSYESIKRRTMAEQTFDRMVIEYRKIKQIK